MSLRWRWALTLAGLAAIAVIVVTVAGLVVTQRQFRAAVDDDLRSRLASVADLDLRDAPQRPFGGRDGRLPVALDAILEVTTLDGVVIVESTPDLPRIDPDGRPSLHDLVIDGTRYRMIEAVVGVDRPLRPRAEVVEVEVRIAVDTTPSVRTLRALVGQMVRVGAVIILVAGLVGWLIARRTVGPLERLTATAERVAATEDLTATISEAGPDEIRRLATAFRQMLDSLRRSRVEQQRLVGDAGHEFRTPLTALRTNLETLRRRGGELSEEQWEMLLDAAIAETSELSTLATELVDLATDFRHTEESTVEVDLAAMAERVARRFAQRTGRSIDVTGNGATVEGRASQLERALANLVDNALKWSEGTVQIALDGTTVTVLDRGPGIPDDDIDQIFERFYRSGAARGVPGSGLGLAIVDHVVSAHRGRTFARNRDDGGAAVGFDLPQPATATNETMRPG